MPEHNPFERGQAFQADRASGLPGILEEINEQFLLPPLHAGWTVRRRSRHFESYEEVSKRFGKLLGIDPWLINPLFSMCKGVEFSSAGDLQALAASVDALLGKIRRKYKEYGIGERPFVALRADNGAESPGFLTVRDAKDLQALARKNDKSPPATRAGGSKNGAIKSAPATRDLLVQEGVLTQERIHDAVAEPVVYMVDRYVVGGFYRVHAGRGVDEDLSAPGSSFVPLAFSSGAQLPQPGARPGVSAPNRFYMYGVIARLAMLAASYELEATDPQAEAFA